MLLALRSLYDPLPEFIEQEPFPTDPSTSAPSYWQSSNNLYGEIVDLAPTVMDVVITQTVTDRRYIIQGGLVTGSGPGKAQIKLDGVVVWTQRVNDTYPESKLILPAPYLVEVGGIITVEVTNLDASDQTFEVTLLGI